MGGSCPGSRRQLGIRRKSQPQDRRTDRCRGNRWRFGTWERRSRARGCSSRSWIRNARHSSIRRNDDRTHRRSCGLARCSRGSSDSRRIARNRRRNAAATRHSRFHLHNPGIAPRSDRRRVSRPSTWRWRYTLARRARPARSVGSSCRRSPRPALRSRRAKKPRTTSSSASAFTDQYTAGP